MYLYCSPQEVLTWTSFWTGFVAERGEQLEPQGLMAYGNVRHRQFGERGKVFNYRSSRTALVSLQTMAGRLPLHGLS